MNNRKVYMYVFDTMADWEVGYITAELNTGRYFRKGLKPLKVITVGADKTPIMTMGGLKVLPEITVEECNLEGNDLIILPGGDTWTTDAHEGILEKCKNCLGNGVVVAGICGATFGLAKKGLLDFKKHTSNDLEFLKMIVPGYLGEEFYRSEGAVCDGNLITASGIAPLEFTREILRVLDVFSEDGLEAWFNLYKTNEPRYFFELDEFTRG